MCQRYNDNTKKPKPQDTKDKYTVLKLRVSQVTYVSKI